MALVKLQNLGSGCTQLTFLCPACHDEHSVRIFKDSNKGWTWNGSTSFPTINPSVLVNHNKECPDMPVCHSQIEEGVIHYYGDSDHEYSGQVLNLPNC